MSVVISVVIGYVLDMLIGTPKILKKGKLLILKGLKNLYSKISDKLAMVITIIFIVFSGLIVYGIIYCVEYYNMIASIVLQSIICYFCISCKLIKTSAESVHKALKRGYIKNATRLFSKITENGQIDEPKEIAENIIVMIMDSSIDKVIAPIFFIMLFGGTGGIVYKIIVIINDATGNIIARILKNIAELIPTRIALIFMLVSAKVLKLDCKAGLKILNRDRYNVSSLNRGLPLSFCAGALGIQLKSKKTGVVIGDAKRDVNHNDITKSFELINIASLLTLVGLVAIRLIFVIHI